LKIGGYDLGPDRQGEVPNFVDDSFLQRESGIFGFPLLEESAHLGIAQSRTLHDKLPD
jgi:hypothetical protein